MRRAYMGSLVDLQSLLASERLAAAGFGAHERSLTCVNHQMCFKVPSSLKLLSAKVAFVEFGGRVGLGR